MIEIIIDKEEEKKTIGVIENGKLIEVYEENKENKHERNEGNIYVGIVKDIIPGMQAAFIDIGTEKNSFIHVRDIMPQIDEKIERKEEKKIKDLVKPKQKLLVQVQKDSNDKKGARTTTHIKLTGKYVILLPQTTIVTVSQKIQDETEKNRLIKLVKENLQENMGAIIRTVAEKKENEIIIEDLQKLQEQWQDIYQKFKKSDSKSQLLYTSPSIVEKIILDLPSEKIDSIIVNTKEDYSELEQMVSHKIKLALEENKNLIKKYDADVVRYSRSYRTVKDGKVIAEEKTSFKAGVYSSSQFAANFDQINKAGEGIWAGIYRRAFLQKNQIDFDETMKFGYEDLDFITKIYLCSPSVVLNPKTYYVWIMRYAHSTSGKTDINNITSLMKCLENKSRLVTQTGIETQIPAFWVEELSRRIYTIVRYVSPKKVKMPFGKRIELLKYFRTAAVFQQPTDKKKTKAFKKQSKPGWLIWYLFDKKHYWLLYFLVTGKQRLSEK